MTGRETCTLLNRINRYQDSIYDIADAITRLDKVKDTEPPEMREGIDTRIAAWERRVEEYTTARDELVGFALAIGIPVAKVDRDDDLWRQTWVIMR